MRATTGKLVRKGSALVVFVGITVAAIAGMVFLASSQAAAQAGAARQSADAPAGNAERGRAIYNRVGCWECHGLDAQSGGGTGPKLGPPPMPYPAFTNQLRKPRNQMPPYTAKVLPDADVADIYAFVKTLPQPPKADSLTLLK